MNEDKRMDLLIYTVILDESERLKRTISRSERNEIRNFISKCYESYRLRVAECEIPGISPENQRRRTHERFNSIRAERTTAHGQ